MTTGKTLGNTYDEPALRAAAESARQPGDEDCGANPTEQNTQDVESTIM